MKCRHCEKPLKHTFLDLGFSPPSNAYLTEEELKEPEKYYPLKIKVCDQCWLVQTEDYAQVDELFSSDYAYFSSTSSSWLEHAKKFAEKAEAAFGLGAQSLVIEVASNDGYLLKNFLRAGIPCLGIEPTDSTATVAEGIGIPVLREFFGGAVAQRLADDGQLADLIVGNNVYAHVPDINAFTRGLKIALKPYGVITLEFPHLLQLINCAQFDTLYHEHFSYLSLFVVNRIFRKAGLRVWDVEELPSHGGSLRVYGCHDDDPRLESGSVKQMLEMERDAGLGSLETYLSFQVVADAVKHRLLSFLLTSKQQGKRVAAYGAAAKGNTLLNYAGIRTDLIEYVCDAAPAKQGKYLPGSHIPIFAPEALRKSPPDILLLLPWNLRAELAVELADIVERGTKLYVAVPTIEQVS